MKLFRKKQVTKKTIFDMPIIETKEKFEMLSNIIYEIIGSDSFAQLSSKVAIPLGSTQQDVARLLKENAPKKVKIILDMLLKDNFENIIKFSSIIFCEDYDDYCKKSINEIVEDYMSLSKENSGKLLSFFSHAG